jgi:phosphoribosylformimino-5-aminoimidazole carboxamide ribotide isomerase
MNKWQNITDLEVNRGESSSIVFGSILHQDIESIDMLSEYCSEFLIHAADVEGLCQGIDEELVTSSPSILIA